MLLGVLVASNSQLFCALALALGSHLGSFLLVHCALALALGSRWLCALALALGSRIGSLLLVLCELALALCSHLSYLLLVLCLALGSWKRMKINI